MSDQKTTNDTTVRTPDAVLSYPRLDKPYSGFDNQEPKYQCDLLIPKTSSIDHLKAALGSAMTKKFGAREKWPKGFKSPIRDGDEKEDSPEYAGHWYITVKNKRPPRLLDNGKQTLPANAFYGGCIVQAVISAYGYDKAGNRGVAFSLEGLQFRKDGERFGGGGDCADMFENFEDGSENPESYKGGDGEASPF